MRKLITVILALIIALTPVLACAETTNLAALLGDKSNKNLGNEKSVYSALYKILTRANGKEFPLRDMMYASTYVSKISTGEAFSALETHFDESLSAYEKFFVVSLCNTTLADEDAEALTTFLDGSVKSFPADGKSLYVAEKDRLVPGGDGEAEEAAEADKAEETEDAGEAEKAEAAKGPRSARGPRGAADAAAKAENQGGFLTDLMRQATEKMGFKYEPETINDALTLYSIKDQDGNVLLTAHDVLTTLPHAILMKHVPDEKKQESAAAIARIEASIPDIFDWSKVTKGEDEEVSLDELDNVLGDFLEESDEEELEDEDDEEEEEAAEKKVELTEEQIAEWTDKWLKLFTACDAYDLNPGEETYKAVCEAMLAMTDLKPEITLEPENGISFHFKEEEAPAATNAPEKSSSGGGSSGGSKEKTPAKELVTLTGSLTQYTGKYIIYVSKGSCTIAIIGRGKDKRWTKLVSKFPTSIGKAGQTRSGTFWVSKKERWHSWSGSSYSPYSVKQSGGSYIHGPIYTAKDSNKMVASSYNSIGTRSSAGCLGTVCAAAGFIYFNCPIGTMVIIADDSKFKASRPKKIPDDQTYDPTEKNIKKTGNPDASIAPTTAGASTPAASSSNDSSSGNSNNSNSSGNNNSSSNNNNSNTANAQQKLEIKKLQSLLYMYHYLNHLPLELGDDLNTPTIGDNTKNAIIRYQTDKSLPATGENTEELINALMTDCDATIKAVRLKLGLTEEAKIDEDFVKQVQAYQETETNQVKLIVDNVEVTVRPIGGITDIATLAALLGPAPTTPEQPVEDKTLKSFTVSPASLELEVNETKDLTTCLTITKDPTNVEATFTYSVEKIDASDDEFISITDNKTLNAVAEGKAKIVVKSNVDGIETKTVEVTVKPAFESIDAQSTSDEIKKIQHLLVILDKVTADKVTGTYADTSDAVKAFQKATEGLTEKDEVDKATYKALTEAAEPIVKLIQDKLIEFGKKADNTEVKPNLADGFEKTEDYGVFNSTTINALKAFQQKFNEGKTDEAEKLNTEGIADAATRTALNVVYPTEPVESSEKPKTESTPAGNAVIEAPEETVVEETVAEKKLESFTVADMAFEVGESARKLEISMVPADCTNVKSPVYQSGNLDIARIDSEGNVTPLAAGETTVSVTLNLADGAAMGPVTANIRIEAPISRGDKNDTVLDAQTMLVVLGELTDDSTGKARSEGVADGDFGGKTEAAVTAFQSDHGLNADGKLTRATLDKLRDASRSPITAIQENLFELDRLDRDDYDEDLGGTLELGVYDRKTRSAVEKFQKDYNGDEANRAAEDFIELYENGVADKLTQRKIKEAVAALHAPAEVPAEAPVDAPAAAPETPAQPAAEQPVEQPAAAPQPETPAPETPGDASGAQSTEQPAENPEPQTDAQPEQVAPAEEPQAEQPASEPQSETEQQPEPEPQSEPEQQSEPERQPETESTESKAEPEPEPAPEPEPQVQEVQAASEPEPAPAPEPAPEPVQESQSESQSESQPEPVQEAMPVEEAAPAE